LRTLRCAASEAMTSVTPRVSRAAQSAVRLASVEPGTRWLPRIPKYGASQATTRSSRGRATGAVSGCSRF